MLGIFFGFCIQPYGGYSVMLYVVSLLYSSMLFNPQESMPIPIPSSSLPIPRQHSLKTN